MLNAFVSCGTKSESLLQVSNRIGIDFAQECAVYGFPLNVPTVTLPATVAPSGGNPTDSTATVSPQSPPTGLPSSFFSINGAASTTASQSGPTSSATGSVGSKSGAIRVGNRAEVICVLFSVCLMTAVLVLAA